MWRAGPLRIQMCSKGSCFLPCIIDKHWIAAGACRKAYTERPFPKPTFFYPSHNRNFLSRLWFCPVLFNRGIYCSWILSNPFFAPITILVSTASCGNGFHTVTKACQISHMGTSWDSQLMYDLWCMTSKSRYNKDVVVSWKRKEEDYPRINQILQLVCNT